jgi:hypothetical protein
MSDQRRLRWKSGRLISSPIADFWGPTLTARDPQIPNLPLETPSSGTSGTVTEALALADTQNASSIKIGTVAEAIALADTPNALLTLPGTVSEAIALADTPDATVTGGTIAGTVEEALALSETQTANRLLPATVSEAVALADTQNAATVFGGAVSEAIALADTQNASSIKVGTVAESIALADETDATRGPSVIDAEVNEALGLADTQDASGPAAPVTFGNGGVPRLFRFQRETDEERDERHKRMYAPKRLERKLEKVERSQTIELRALLALSDAKRAAEEARTEAQRLQADIETKKTYSQAKQAERLVARLKKEAYSLQLQIEREQRDTEEADIAFLVMMLTEL